MNNKLKDIRLKRGMSISELARRSQLSRMTIINIEAKGANPKAKTIKSISSALDKSPEEIFFN